MESDRRHSLLKQGSLYSVAAIAPLLVAAAITPLVTRTLGPTEYGVLAVCLSVLQVAQVPLALGLPAALNRHVILERSGAAGASGQIVIVTGIVALVTVPLAAACYVLLMSQGFAPIASPIALAVASGGLLAVFNCIQSLLLGCRNAERFVLQALALGLAPPVMGIGLTSLGQGTASSYLTGLVAAQGVCVATFLFLVLQRYRPRISWPEFRRGVRVGLPTVPHQLSSMAVPAFLIVSAGWLDGDSSASGELQLALLVGSAPLIFIGALNNSWATRAYAASSEQRASFLGESAITVALVALVLSWFTVLLAPVGISWLAPATMDSTRMTLAACLAASAAPLVVLYFANVHQVFASGKTRGLALTTPLSATVALAFAISCVQLWPQRSLEVLALSLIAFQATQVLFSTLLRKRSGMPHIPLSRAAGLTALAMTGSLIFAVVNPGPWVRLTALVVTASVAGATGLRLRWSTNKHLPRT